MCCICSRLLDAYDVLRATRYERRLLTELEPRRELLLPPVSTPVTLSTATCQRPSAGGHQSHGQRRRRSTQQDDEQEETIDEEQEDIEN